MFGRDREETKPPAVQFIPSQSHGDASEGLQPDNRGGGGCCCCDRGFESPCLNAIREFTSGLIEEEEEECEAVILMKKTKQGRRRNSNGGGIMV